MLCVILSDLLIFVYGDFEWDVNYFIHVTFQANQFLGAYCESNVLGLLLESQVTVVLLGNNSRLNVGNTCNK